MVLGRKQVSGRAQPLVDPCLSQWRGSSLAWFVTSVVRHWRGSSLAWFVTSVVRHWRRSSLASFVTGVVRHWRGSSLAWFVTGVVRHWRGSTGQRSPESPALEREERGGGSVGEGGRLTARLASSWDVQRPTNNNSRALRSDVSTAGPWWQITRIGTFSILLRK